MALTRTYHPSIGAAIEYINTVPARWSQKQSRTLKAEREWDLRTGYTGALDLARDGWTAGGDKLEAILATLPKLPGIPRDAFDVAGGSPHIGRYIADRPDCMVTKKRTAERSKRPIISLAVNVTAACNQNAESMSNYGLAVARMVETLEQAGQRVEVLACIITQDSHAASVGWTVKEASEYLNTNDLAFAIGHPAAFRRIGFALLERTPHELSCYGYPQTLTRRHLPDDWQEMSGLVILNGMMRANACAGTPERAIAHLEEQIAAALAEIDKDDD